MRRLSSLFEFKNLVVLIDLFIAEYAGKDNK